MSEITLKHCPFCGGEASVAKGFKDSLGFWHAIAVCNGIECGAGVQSIPSFDAEESMQDAAERWNLRAERTCRDACEKSYRFRCSECGAELDLEAEEPTLWDGGGSPLPVSFCPNCGARVVKQ